MLFGMVMESVQLSFGENAFERTGGVLAFGMGGHARARADDADVEDNGYNMRIRAVLDEKRPYKAGHATRLVKLEAEEMEAYEKGEL